MAPGFKIVRRLRTRLSAIRQDAGGATAIIYAVTAPVLLLAAGMAIDYERALSDATQIQVTLDAAALGAAREVGLRTDKAVASTAIDLFNANADTTSVRATALTPSVDAKGRTVKLAGSFSVDTAFLNLFGIDHIGLKLVSKARGPGINPCVIALDPSASGAFAVSGNGSVNVPNCPIYVDSDSPTALSQTGNSGSVTAKAIYVTGSYDTSSHVSPAPYIGQPVYADPLADVPEPAPPGPCTVRNKNITTSTTFPAGSVFCGAIQFNADVTFAPGIHYFKNATVSVKSSIDFVGNGVMLYFDANSFLSKAAGGGEVSLTAMSSGPYKGIAIFASRAASKMLTFTLTGDQNYYIDGTIYMPKARLRLYGTADVTVSSKSGYVIARQFYYQGDSSFTMEAYGGLAPGQFWSNSTLLIQ